MKRQDYILLFIFGLIVRVAIGLIQKSPGFMDAEYYFIGARNLFQGFGFTENILWHFLDDPSGIPHPSHGYWMPLPSILGAIGLFVAQSEGFRAAQFVFILIGSLLPPLTAYLSYLIIQERAYAILAGSLAVLSGLYLPYMTTTESIGVYAILGVCFFILLSEPHVKSRVFSPIAMGAIAGLMHLSRTDGILWLGLAVLAVWLSTESRCPNSRKKLPAFVEETLLTIGGYLIVMGPWFIRNLGAFGSPLAPGSSRSLWIIIYDELFSYPASLLTMERWLAAGLGELLKARGWSLAINLSRTIVEQGMIFLFPLILIGLWKYRRDPRVIVGVLTWLGTFGLMTIVFPYQGARGGFFHSCAALISLWWSFAMVGFKMALEWAHRVRKWDIWEARMFFSVAMLVFTLGLTIYNAWNKFARDGENQWEMNHISYQAVEEALVGFGASPEDAILSINPPGYNFSTYRPTIAIPNGDIQVTFEVADDFGAKYLVLEEKHPEDLGTLFENPEMQIDGLKFLGTIGEAHLYSFE